MWCFRNTLLFFYLITFIRRFSTFSPIDYASGTVSFASLAEYPYFVSISSIVEDKHICGGTIISSTLVLTPCHCVQKNTKGYISIADVAKYQVKGGTLHTTKAAERTVQYRYVEMVIPHSNCEYGNIPDFVDIAALKLSSPFRFNYFVRPWKPCRKQVVIENCFVIQWGKIPYHFPAYSFRNNRYILTYFVTAITNARCEYEICNGYQEVDLNCTFVPGKYEMCVNVPGKRIFSYEMGGFLLCNNCLLGMKSCPEIATCHLTKSPEVYVQVGSFIKFANDLVGGSNLNHNNHIPLYVFFTLSLSFVII